MVYQPTAKCSMRQLTVALHYAVSQKSHRRRHHSSDPQLLRRELNGGTGLAKSELSFHIFTHELTDTRKS